METISEAAIQTVAGKRVKKRNNSSSEVLCNDAVQRLQLLIADMGFEMHPIMSEQNDCSGDELQLKKKNYFGRLSEMFIEERLLKKPGDYVISRTHDDIFRFSVMSERHEKCHLLILKFCRTYTFENSIYPLAVSIARLIQKCIRSPMNVLSAILRTNVILRHFINSNVEDEDDYSFSGLFLRENDIIKTESLISKGTIADCFLGSLRTLNKCERVVIKVMHKYDHNELNNICRELHISNLLRQFVSTDSVIAVQSVRVFQSPYMIIYPFMNYGSYPDFAQRMGSKLTFMDKLKIAQTIAQALSDMHFLGLLHCDIGARNIFVRKIMISNSSKIISYHSHYGYKYYLGDYRESHIGKTKKVNPKEPINIRWLAPEVFQTKQLTEATDVFAFGITLYEIFTGNLPYFSMNSDEIRTKLIAGYKIRPKTHNTELPRKVIKLMRRCWHTKVNERPTMDGVWLQLKAIWNSVIAEQKCSQYWLFACKHIQAISLKFNPTEALI
ncbi:Protein tyrosine kinase family protein [Acanthocheilonema viteae]